MFAFTAIGATQHFQHFTSGPASVAITGRTYHRIFDLADNSHSLHWFLYDSGDREQMATQFSIPPDWSDALADDLDAVNPYLHHLRRFASLPSSETAALQLSEFGSNGDFAAVMHAGNSTAISPRTIVIWRNHDAAPSFVPIYSRHYEPLQFPLLFPHGTPGWGLQDNGGPHLVNSLPLTQHEWYKNRLLTDNRFSIFGRLTCEYLCDMYSRIEEERLRYIRRSKEKTGQDGTLRDEIEEEGNLELPSSFMGSRKWASEQTADSLTLARTYGPPSFFITMTCNPEWPEIKSRLHPGQQSSDLPVVVARAFKIRLQHLLHVIRTKMGQITYLTSSIEFQKRGLPHCHIVLQVRTDSLPYN
jgi:hypothetical protein